MKKLIYLITLCPMLLIAGPLDEEITKSPDQITRESQEAKILKQRQEYKEKIRRQRELEDAQEEQAFNAKLASARTGTKVETSQQPEASIKLNFAEYAREEAQLKIERQQEDKARQKLWKQEDDAAVDMRNKEGFWTRVTHALSSDSAADAEKEGSRNKVILETNKERIYDDFARKAKRFEAFKQAHPEFAKAAPWDNLLDLGDMNKFVNMSHDERTAFTAKIEDTVNQLLSDDNAFKGQDINALTDLIQLTRLHDLGDASLPAEFEQKFQTTFTSEFSGKTPEEQQEIVHALKEMLKESLTASVKMLQDFNTTMQEIEGDIKTLETLRTIKNVGNAAFWIMGTVAGVLMLSHGTIVIKGVQLTMEKFAIGAKIGILAGHTAAHSEAELSKAIQNKFQKIFSPMLPKTVELLDTITYKNTAKSLTQRIKDNVSDIQNRITNSKLYNKVTNHPVSKAISEKASNLATSAKEGLNALRKGVQEDPTYQATKQMLSSGAHGIKDSATRLQQRIVTHPRYLAAKDTAHSTAAYVKDKAHSAATAIKEKMNTASKKVFGEKTTEVDTSEFNLRTPQPQAS